MPWSARTRGAAGRARAVWSAALRIPRRRLLPFSAVAAAGATKARECIGIPRAAIDRVSHAPLAHVPALLLAGGQDLRTPVSDARAVARSLPGAALVEVPGQGHSVIGERECAAVALARFAHGQPVGAPCARDGALIDPAPLPAPSVARLPVAEGLGGSPGRTLVAVQRTVRDALVVALTIWSARRTFTIAELGGGTVAGDRETGRLRLTRAVFIPGVTVSGTLALGGSGGGTLSVTGARGAVSGTVRIDPAGVSGVLGGRRFGSASAASLARGLRVSPRAFAQSWAE